MAAIAGASAGVAARVVYDEAPRALGDTPVIPGTAAQDDPHDREHHWHLDQYADHGCQCGTRLKAETSGCRTICSPWNPNSKTSVARSATSDTGCSVRKVRVRAVVPPRCRTARRQSCAAMTGTTM